MQLHYHGRFHEERGGFPQRSQVRRQREQEGGKWGGTEERQRENEGILYYYHFIYMIDILLNHEIPHLNQ